MNPIDNIEIVSDSFRSWLDEQGRLQVEGKGKKAQIIPQRQVCGG